MRETIAITRRELAAYFKSPLAYVYLIVFLAMSGGLTFYLGGFLDRDRADLVSFFGFHPWLYLFLMPAIGMRLWAEERKTGTIEFLTTLPIPVTAAVVGKFLAAWLFALLALSLTAPIWITVNHLGDPDNGIIIAAYLGSWLMAGGFLAVSACLSALTANQVIAFVLGVTVCFLFMVTGLELVQALIRPWAPPLIERTVADLSFLSNFDAIARGVIEMRDVAYFVTLIAAALTINVAIVALKRGG